MSLIDGRKATTAALALLLGVPRISNRAFIVTNLGMKNDDIAHEISATLRRSHLRKINSTPSHRHPSTHPSQHALSKSSSPPISQIPCPYHIPGTPSPSIALY